MNIFDTLVRGKGCINEENVSSFLGYLLDPSEDHGLKSVFLDCFLAECLNVSESEIKLTSSDDISIQYEFAVKNRYIDIVFETSEHIIAIENKILEQSKQDGQLQEEYDGLKECETYKNSSKKIIMCYLVPQNTNDKIVLKDKEDKLEIVLWEKVINLLKQILVDENNAEINPINDYLKSTIKAFINFMNSSIEPKTFKLDYDKSVYRIYRYSSGKIILEKETKDGWECVSARDILRHKLSELDSENYTYDSTKDGNKFTTHILGSLVFKRLSK